MIVAVAVFIPVSSVSRNIDSDELRRILANEDCSTQNAHHRTAARQPNYHAGCYGTRWSLEHLH